jgi:hypothetical protein
MPSGRKRVSGAGEAVCRYQGPQLLHLLASVASGAKAGRGSWLTRDTAPGFGSISREPPASPMCPRAADDR